MMVARERQRGSEMMVAKAGETERQAGSEMMVAIERQSDRQAVR